MKRCRHRKYKAIVPTESKFMTLFRSRHLAFCVAIDFIFVLSTVLISLNIANFLVVEVFDRPYPIFYNEPEIRSRVVFFSLLAVVLTILLGFSGRYSKHYDFLNQFSAQNKWCVLMFFLDISVSYFFKSDLSRGWMLVNWSLVPFALILARFFVFLIVRIISSSKYTHLLLLSDSLDSEDYHRVKTLFSAGDCA